MAVMDLGILADPGLVTELVLEGLVRGSMYALMGAGLSLIFGILGIVNFAHGELYMIGAYLMYLVSILLGLPLVVGIVAAAGGLFLVGMLIERGLIELLRRRAGREWLLDSFVLTIGLMVILQNLALVTVGSERLGLPAMVAGTLTVGQVSISYDRLVILGVSFLAVAALWAFVRFTDIGKAIRATAQDPEAAQTLGIDIERIYTFAFGLGALMAGLAGALLLPILPAYPTVGAQPVLKSFAVVILGGLGNVPGAVAGGALLGIVEAFAVFFLSAGWQSVLTPLLIVVVLLFRPSGLFSSAGARP
jgi:branched-chain amino acid transport system permease protein